MFKSNLILLIGIACSCVFARSMERREEDHHHHHHYHHHHQHSVAIDDKNSTHQHNISSLVDPPANLLRGVGEKTTAKPVNVGDKDVLSMLKDLEERAKDIFHAHKRSSDEPIAKNLDKSCCG